VCHQQPWESVRTYGNLNHPTEQQAWKYEYLVQEPNIEIRIKCSFSVSPRWYHYLLGIKSILFFSASQSMTNNFVSCVVFLSVFHAPDIYITILFLVFLTPTYERVWFFMMFLCCCYFFTCFHSCTSCLKTTRRWDEALCRFTPTSHVFFLELVNWTRGH